MTTHNPGAPDGVRCHGVFRASGDGARTWDYTRERNSTSDWFDYFSIALTHGGAILVMAQTTADARGVPGFAKAGRRVVFRVSLNWLTEERMEVSATGVSSSKAGLKR